MAVTMEESKKVMETEKALHVTEPRHLTVMAAMRTGLGDLMVEGMLTDLVRLSTGKKQRKA